MSETINPAHAALPLKPHLDKLQYEALYRQSIQMPDIFWAEQAQAFSWHRQWDCISTSQFTDPVTIRWFEGARLNISENCMDRHLTYQPDKPAIIWQADDVKQSRIISYQTLFEEVCKLANALRALGVKKGDRVTLYMPMVPEAAYAMLACARIGAIHSVIFAGFSADAVASRIYDCDSKIILTADGTMRGGKQVALKETIDKALTQIKDKDFTVEKVIVLNHTQIPVTFHASRDCWYHELVATMPTHCEAESMESEDPLFILYTSGSTGAPKGLVHTCAGYMVYAALTHKLVFDIRPHDVYWCTADIGWITGHSYVVYGPLLNGSTTLMFEGIPTYPDASRYWHVVDDFQVTKFYTAPTAIRALMAQGDAYVNATSRASLKILGSVGEPINPEAWWWYYRTVGKSACPIVDTWWQTETGGHMITPLPYATALKAGSASFPFLGIEPVLVDASGARVEGEGEGMLCIARSWPGQARSIWGDHARFISTYFSPVTGMYFTSDGARRDSDGYYWITGRVDDVINVSGHRLGTAEIESALVAHPDVAEAAVVGIAHPIKGQAIYAYVTLGQGATMATENYQEVLKAHVRATIGGLATPEYIHITPSLPKTRSGKIMRRILRKIAEGDVSNLDDISTLLNPEIVEYLLNGRK